MSSWSMISKPGAARCWNSSACRGSRVASSSMRPIASLPPPATGRCGRRSARPRSGAGATMRNSLDRCGLCWRDRSMRKPWACFICIGLLALAPLRIQAQASAHESLVSLAQDMTYTSARLYPMQATALGIAGHDGDLETPSEAYRAAYVDRLKQWQQRLREITAAFDSATSLVDRDDATLLNAQLEAQLNSFLVYQADRKDYSAPANSVVQAIFNQFEHLPVVGRDGASPAA